MPRHVPQSPGIQNLLRPCSSNTPPPFSPPPPHLVAVSPDLPDGRQLLGARLGVRLKGPAQHAQTPQRLRAGGDVGLQPAGRERPEATLGCVRSRVAATTPAPGDGAAAPVWQALILAAGVHVVGVQLHRIQTSGLHGMSQGCGVTQALGDGQRQGSGAHAGVGTTPGREPAPSALPLSPAPFFLRSTLSFQNAKIPRTRSACSGAAGGLFHAR